MNFFILSQQGAPNPGWALQYTPDLKPAAARTYEPLALATHTTASNLEHLITFYDLTGDTRYLARVPEGIDWLEKVKLAKPDAAGRTHPTYIELQTNRPMYVHRRGSNIVNGEYYADYNPERPIGHYGQTRKLNTAALRKHYEEALKADVKELAKNSPLAAGAGIVELPRFFADRYAPPADKDLAGPGARLARGAEQDGLLARAVAADQPSLQGHGRRRQKCPAISGPRTWAMTRTLRRSRTRRRPRRSPRRNICAT